VIFIAGRMACRIIRHRFKSPETLAHNFIASKSLERIRAQRPSRRHYSYDGKPNIQQRRQSR
jgi:hypothetical protein